MQPEEIKFNLNIIDSVYPFNLLIKNDHGRPVIDHWGPSLDGRIAGIKSGNLFGDHFDFHRPRIEVPDFNELCNLTGKLVSLKVKGCEIVLRGQLVQIADQRLFYIATLHLTSPDDLSGAEISLAEFPAHDLIPDLLILQSIKEIQLEELSKQNQELSSVIKERDRFDRYANTDSMTQLLNRRGFQHQATDFLQNIDRSSSALLLLDVDNFKSINDTHGHAAGDAVLKEVARRLQSSFGENSVVGRLGGDEFIVLSHHSNIFLSDRDQNNDCIEHLRGHVEFNSRKIDVSLSCGLVDLDAAEDLERLIHYADLTMYEGRKQKSGQTVFFKGNMQKIIERRESISRLIIPAMDTGEIEAWYQPIVDIENGNVMALEALARWPSKELGMVSPQDFIAVADSMDLLKKFDRMMLDKVCRQLSQWRDTFPDLRIHINMSGPSFTAELPDTLCALMDQYKLPRNRLVVELTETSLLLLSDEIAQIITELASRGFMVELDDFGTGYSSMHHLKNFPVTGLKVDMCFVKDAADDERTRHLLAGILNIANILTLHSVGEGVETIEQLNMLAEMGCRSIQGYLFSKPMQAGDCADWIHTQNLSDGRKAA